MELVRTDIQTDFDAGTGDLSEPLYAPCHCPYGINVLIVNVEKTGDKRNTHELLRISEYFYIQN